MTFEGHFVFSLASIILVKKLALSNVMYNCNWIHLFIGSFLTCIVPDIDHPKSYLGRRLKWISITIFKYFGHRGITHSLFAVVGFSNLLFSKTLLSLLTVILPMGFIYAMVVGYVSHILADMLTPMGVQLLWPCKWYFCIPILNSNKYPKWEKIFCLLVLAFVLFYPFDLFISNFLKKQLITYLNF